MKIKALVPWFGSKRGLAPTIIEEIGLHRSYFEICLGSAAVLLLKAPAAMETVCDLHGGLINLARVLQEPEQAYELFRRTSLTLCSTEIFKRSQMWIEGNPEATGLDAAYHYFVVSWMGRSGTAGCLRTNYQPSVRFTPGGGSSSTRWQSATDSIPDWHQRLRNVLILDCDAFEIIDKISDEEGVAIYVDPPYLKETRAGGAKYLHEFDEADHQRLATALSRFEKARVVVSYYDDPRLDELYPGWIIRECYRQKNLHVQNRRGMGKCVAPEVLLLNGPSYATEASEVDRDVEGMLFE